MSEYNTSEVIELLKSYKIYEEQVFSEKYAKTFFDPYEKFQELDSVECQKKMNLIKSLIAGLAPSRFATILNLHYVNTLPVEKCAECMVLSKRTAYRLLNRAHIAASNRYQRMKGGAE